MMNMPRYSVAAEALDAGMSNSVDALVKLTRSEFLDANGRFWRATRRLSIAASKFKDFELFLRTGILCLRLLDSALDTVRRMVYGGVTT